jgi:DNA-binding NarL/FixJ family response regulator
VVRIAVTDPLPLFREGVAAALDAPGHFVEQPGDVLSWRRSDGLSVVVLTLESERDWSLLATITAQRPDFAVIVLLADPHPAAGARAVQAGAHSVLPRNTAPGNLRAAVEAVAEGIALLPTDVLQALRTHGTSAGPPLPVLSAEQLSWLRQLAAGVTVHDLAGRSGYSERAMYRLLQQLYRELGVPGRTQALIRAQTMGLLGEPG